LTEYRACILGDNDHFISCRTFVCGNDDDAIVWAQQLVESHDVELWNGERIIKRLRVTKKPGGNAISK
jgi:hypothetical protein